MFRKALNVFAMCSLAAIVFVLANNWHWHLVPPVALPTCVGDTCSGLMPRDVSTCPADLHTPIPATEMRNSTGVVVGYLSMERSSACQALWPAVILRLPLTHPFSFWMQRVSSEDANATVTITVPPCAVQVRCDGQMLGYDKDSGIEQDCVVASVGWTDAVNAAMTTYVPIQGAQPVCAS